jgi:hypothetical protein
MEAEQAEELSTLLQSPHMSGLKDLSIDDNEIGVVTFLSGYISLLMPYWL